MQPILCKDNIRCEQNRAHQSYLILNRQIFCRTIWTEAVWSRPKAPFTKARRCRNSERKPRQNIAEVTILYEYLFRYFRIALSAVPEPLTSS